MKPRHAAALALEAYHVGPVSLTVLLVVASAVHTVALGACYPNCSWGINLIPISWGVAIIWHIALILTQRGNRLNYLAYGLIHLPVMLYVCAMSLGTVTGDWL